MAPSEQDGSAGALQPLVAGVVGALTGFIGSFAIVLAGLSAAGASPREAASGLLVLCVLQAGLTVLLSWRHRLPLGFAWSTPGAALLVSAHSGASFPAAIGAFLVCGLLIVVTGLSPVLSRAITRIPASVSGALLAGILLPLCLVPVTASTELPAYALPIVAVWLVLQRLAPRWSVPAALVVAVLGMAASAAGMAPQVDWTPALVPHVPVFDPAVVVSIGVPLYLVTMASQNVPGLAILRAFGYEQLPTRSLLAGSGAATLLAAPFGGHTINLVALSAAITAGPEASPDRARRWLSSLSSAATYVGFGLAAPAVASYVAGASPVLIEAVAGLALMSALVTGLVAALQDPQERVPAAVTFLVVVSGTTIGGIGSAFWGLLAGGAALLWLRERR